MQADKHLRVMNHPCVSQPKRGDPAVDCSPSHRPRVKFDNAQGHLPTALSKRIQQAIITYDKFVHGPLIAMATGLEVIRAECPRFANWVSKLETLGK